MTLPRYSFSHDEAQAAATDWGMNCGPSALAAIFQTTPDEVRPHLGQFEQRGYMSPTMMAAALRSMKRSLKSARVLSRQEATSAISIPFPRRGLVRIQWTGPWTAPGSNPKWAYRHTHWIASWDASEPPHFTGPQAQYVFDINGGWLVRADWEREIIPLITKSIKRADGGWYPTHLWEL